MEGILMGPFSNGWENLQKDGIRFWQKRRTVYGEKGERKYTALYLNLLASSKISPGHLLQTIKLLYQ